MKVGDYVRFKDKRGNTYIRKVIDGYREHWYGCKIDKNANNVPYVSQKNIIKSSPNIIDLIEVGDLMFLNIANKKEAFKDLVVPRIAETENELQRYLEKLNNGEFALKGILTKEQIENGVYWVNE